MYASGIQIAEKQEASDLKGILSDRTFLITRTLHGNAIEREKLEKFGARVIELSPIKIAFPSSWKKLDDAISRLEEFDWIIFTSANGVKMFFHRCSKKPRARKILERLARRDNPRPKLGCVGPYTKRALEALGYGCSFQPKEYLTSALGEELTSATDVRGKKILLARAERANKEIGNILKRAGAKVYEAHAYRTVPLKGKKLASSLLNSLTDITLTSPSTVKGLLNFVSLKNLSSLSISVHCIGPVTANAARLRGIAVRSVAKEHTIDGLIDSIIYDAQRKRRKILMRLQTTNC
ncbi:MAG: uroporphyrinogen-III synthase [Nitrososphaerales archaeon]